LDLKHLEAWDGSPTPKKRCTIEFITERAEVAS
jgi:hypothetical protein